MPSHKDLQLIFNFTSKYIEVYSDVVYFILATYCMLRKSLVKIPKWENNVCIQVITLNQWRLLLVVKMPSSVLKKGSILFSLQMVMLGAVDQQVQSIGGSPQREERPRRDSPRRGGDRHSRERDRPNRGGDRPNRVGGRTREGGDRSRNRGPGRGNRNQRNRDRNRDDSRKREGQKSKQMGNRGSRKWCQIREKQDAAK